jgi:hypothetical protein
MNTIICTNCSKSFAPLETRFAEFIRKSATNNHDEIGVECPHCEKYTQFNPIAFMKGEPCQVLFAPYRCPVSGCAGFVSFNEASDDDEEFWGCGECGSIWHDKANLLAEIDSIVARFKYRKKCYRKVKKAWVPAALDAEPEDYEDKVADEPEDERDDYVRG